MPTRNRTINFSSLKQHLKLTWLEWAAVGLAWLLSLACLARGAVYDTVLATLLIAAMPVLYLALRDERSIHAGLKRAGGLLLGGLLLTIFLQTLLLPTLPTIDFLNHLPLTGDAKLTILQDRAAQLHSLTRLFFFVVVFLIALMVGASESSARLFLHWLLLSGTFCLALTFFLATSDGVPSSTHNSYTHGFVNANNASAYLGIMLLLALAQAVRFFRRPTKSLHRALLDAVDQLNFLVLFKAMILLSALLLALAGLFMTGSRGGIVLALMCSFGLALMVMSKINLRADRRNAVIVAGALVMGGLLIWSFVNFGGIIASKLNSDGFSANTRLDLYAAVLPMIGDHPLLGTGFGSFAGAFQQYRPDTVPSDGIIDKAHNSYLEFAAEMGIPAFLLLLATLGWAGLTLLQGVRDRRERYIAPALGLSVWLFIGLYSLVDFPLHTPGMSALFLALMVVCVSQTDRHFSEPASSGHAAPVKRVRIRRRRNSVKPM